MDASQLLGFSKRLGRFISFVGNACGACLVLLVAVTIFDVVTRRYFVVGSTFLQELEWHLHTVLFTMALGLAYIENAHVRIDIFRNTLSPPSKAWVEVTGITLLLIPYCCVMIYMGVEFAQQSYAQAETSYSSQGIPYRWAIKAFIPVGMILLLLAGLAVLIQRLIFLFGPPELRSKAAEYDVSPFSQAELP